MGFHAKAEYTLELIKEPRAHELIDQRFVCYGFILSSSTDEYALQALMENWQEIDLITSDRIRYLFFIDREITLTGYPNPPTFTQRGYERAHQKLLGLARRQNFTWKVNGQTEVRFDAHGRPRGPWHPQHKVAQLANQLGIGPMMPCLAWIHEGENKHVFVRSLTGLAAHQIVNEIKRFCTHFYRENVAVFTQLTEIEGQLRDICGSLDITLKDLDDLGEMRRKRVDLGKCIRSLQQLNPEPSKRTVTIGTLSATANELTSLGPLPISSLFNGVLKEVPKWERTLKKVEQCLQGDSDLKVPHLHSAYSYCITFNSKFPEDAVKLRSNKQPENSGHLRRFASCLSDAVLAELAESRAELAVRLRRVWRYLELNVDRIEDGNMPLSDRILTCLNVLMLAREMDTIAEAPQNDHGDLIREMQDNLIAHFQEATHCVAIELHLWMYSELSNAHETLERRIRRTFTTSRLIHEEAFQSKDTIRSLVKVADDKCKRIRCSILDEYERFELPILPRSPIGELLSISSDPEKVADSLVSRLSHRLVPVGEVVLSGECDTLPSYDEMLEKVRSTSAVQILAQSGSQVQLSNSLVYEGDWSVNKQNVTIKDSEISESQIVVAESISESFNRTEASTAPDEIKTKLSALTRVVETVCASLPAETAKDVAKDLEILVGEAVKKEPRRKWYELSAEGLKEAAQKVGEIGKPILGLLKEISGLLGI